MNDIPTYLVDLLSNAPPPSTLVSVDDSGPEPLDVCIPVLGTAKAAQKLPLPKDVKLFGDECFAELDVPVEGLLALASVHKSRLRIELTTTIGFGDRRAHIEQVAVGTADGRLLAIEEDVDIPPKSAMDVGPADVVLAQAPLLVWLIVDSHVAMTRVRHDSTGDAVPT